MNIKVQLVVVFLSTLLLANGTAREHADQVRVKDASGQEVVARVMEARTIRYFTIEIGDSVYYLEVTETPSGRIASAMKSDGPEIGHLILRKGLQAQVLPSVASTRQAQTVPTSKADPNTQVLLSEVFIDMLPAPGDLPGLGDPLERQRKPRMLAEDCEACGGRLMEYCETDTRGRIRDETCKWVCQGGTNCALAGWKSRI